MLFVKSLAEFRRHGGEKLLIVFGRDMCVGENTYRPANVRVVRNGGRGVRCSRAQKFWGKVVTPLF